MTIHVIGGTYKENCAWPEHNTLQGSAGRAALCLSQIEPTLSIKLHARIAEEDAPFLIELFAFSDNCELEVANCGETTQFDYFHPLSEPKVSPKVQAGRLPLFDLSSEFCDIAVIFGMIEAVPVVQCNTAIYDPQNTYNPVLFSDTGSVAKSLAYVTNSNELSIFYEREHSNIASLEVMAQWLFDREKTDAVVVKCGQKGLFVYSSTCGDWVCPYETETVFPIGSGDSFVAAFTYYWRVQGLPLLDAAEKSSIAAAYYVSHKTMNNAEGLEIFGKNLTPKKSSSEKIKVYLAGPFFSLSELWMINETKQYIEAFGMDVFSPYHELGIGSADEVVQKDIDAISECDVMYAIFNGSDPGTLFEIGYARSLNKPVVLLAENPKDEELKMYEGSGCKIFSDFASSIYNLSWVAL